MRECVIRLNFLCQSKHSNVPIRFGTLTIFKGARRKKGQKCHLKLCTSGQIPEPWHFSHCQIKPANVCNSRSGKVLNERLHKDTKLTWSTWQTTKSHMHITLCWNKSIHKVTYQAVVLDVHVCIHFYPLRSKYMFTHTMCFCMGPRISLCKMYAKVRHAIIDNQISLAKRKSESCQQANKNTGLSGIR